MAQDGPVGPPSLVKVAGSVLNSAGEPVEIEFKAYKFRDDKILWQLSRIFDGFFSSQSWDARKELKKIQGRLAYELNEIGSNDNLINVWHDHVKPSQRAAPHWGVVCVDDPYLLDEYTVSTMAAILILLGFASARRYKDERARAAAMLTAFVTRTLEGYSNQSTATFIHEAVSLAAGTDCHAVAKCEGYKCDHIRKVFQPLEDAVAQRPKVAVAEALVALISEKKECHASRLICEVLIKMLVKTIDSAILSFEATRPTHFTQLQGKVKRRRVDKDFREFICNELVAQKAVNGGAAALRIVNGCDGSLARKWERTALVEYWASLITNFKLDGPLHVLEDACRNGMPPKDTLCWALWDSSSDFGGVPPPKAGFHSKP